MELETYQMTIDRYLTHHNYAVIYDNGNEKLIQLKNLKLVWIDSIDLGKYTLEEVTLGRDGSQFENVDISTVIDRIQDLEGGNDSFSKSWHVDDVLMLDSSLSQQQARLVLTMAIDNHDAAVGINWDVLKVYIRQVLEITNTSTDTSSPSRHWFAHNWESESFFSTQAEAIAEANSNLNYCHDSEDSSWADYVEDIYVGYVTHQVKPNNEGYSLVPTSDDNSLEEKLCQRKIATILAALRYFQSSRDYMSLDLPHFIDNEPLSNEEIDELCELINCGEVL